MKKGLPLSQGESKRGEASLTISPPPLLLKGEGDKGGEVNKQSQVQLVDRTV
jgi:hypothetical protein